MSPGSSPSKEGLSPMASNLRSVRRQTSVGMEPMRFLFSYRRRDVSLFKLPIDVGMLPVSWFLASDKYVRSSNDPSSEGILSANKYDRNG